jgi:hypothetical protein
MLPLEAAYNEPTLGIFVIVIRMIGKTHIFYLFTNIYNVVYVLLLLLLLLLLLFK